jgi:hypothetical protein
MLVPAVRRRIRRWDGSCAYKGTTDAPRQITPDDVRTLLTEVRNERGTTGGFDVKVSGGDPAEFAAAGATWWGRWIAPASPEDTLAVIRQGPPRVISAPSR